MAQSHSPEIRDAIVRGAAVEAVLIAVGVVLFVTTGQVVWPIGAAVLGGVVMALFLAQTGAFKSRMADATPPNGLPRVKTRLPFAPVQSPLSGQSGKVFLLAVLMAACAGAAAYMLIVQRMPWADMRVVGPAIGALWFGLRIFMNLTPKV